MRVFGDYFSGYFNIASMKGSYQNAKFQPKRSVVIKNKQRVARKNKGKKKELEEQQKAEAEAKAKAEKEYYNEHFEEIMVKKILDGEKLSEKELRAILEYEIDRENGENRRWSRTVTSILEMCGRYFALKWEEGLTEYQDNEFYNQPYEVVKKTYQKTITVTEWVEVEKT